MSLAATPSRPTGRGRIWRRLGRLTKVGVIVALAGLIVFVSALLVILTNATGGDLAGSSVEPISGLQPGQTARVVGTIVGTPGTVVLSAQRVSCGGGKVVAFCWAWNDPPFTITANGSFLAIDTSVLASDGTINGAPHDINPSGNEILEYRAGDSVAVGGTVSGGGGALTMRAIALAPTLAGIPVASESLVVWTVSALLVGLAGILVGAVVAVAGLVISRLRRVRPPGGGRTVPVARDPKP